MTLQELFASDGTWCRGGSRDGSGNLVQYDQAVQWCIIAGLLKCHRTRQEYDQALERVFVAFGGVCDIGGWNDDPSRTIDDIRDLVRRAGV